MSHSPNIISFDSDSDSNNTDDDDLEITNIITSNHLPSSSTLNDPDDDEDISITNVRRNATQAFSSSHSSNNDDDDITVTSTVVRSSSPSNLPHRYPYAARNNIFYPNMPNLNVTITNLGSYALHLPDGNTIQLAARRLQGSNNDSRNNPNQWTAQGEMPPFTFTYPPNPRESSPYTFTYPPNSRDASPQIPPHIRNERRLFLEQQQLRLAQILSSEHYAQHAHDSAPTLASVKKLPPPKPAQQGCSRALKKSNKYACALCGTRLAIGFPKEGLEKQGEESKYRGINDTHRSLSRRVFFSTCGHVFCGWCVSRIANRKNLPDQNKKQRNKRQKPNKREPQPLPSTDPIPLMQMYIPASCTIDGCHRQFRSKSFKEIFL